MRGTVKKPALQDEVEDNLLATFVDILFRQYALVRQSPFGRP